MSGTLGAIVLTGGASSRMGVDKASQLWGGRRAVDLVADLARNAGAARIVTAGDGEFGLPHAPDPRPQSGPVAGVMAGLRWMGSGVDRVLILAVDAPTLQLSDVSRLLESAAPGAAFEGLPLPMVLEVAAVPAEAEAEWPLRRLVERAGLLQLTPSPDALLRLRGANTPEEYGRLAREAGLPRTPI